MNYDNTASDVIEVGKAQEVILGEKPGTFSDVGEQRPQPDNDLDD